VTRNYVGDVITVDLDCGDCRGGDRGAFELVDVGVVRTCGMPEHAVGLLRRLKDLGFHPCEFVFNVDPIDGWAAELWPTECLG
jgi:hypothetical protein